ncbi:hypothetical protein CEXT_476761 [Caerostris extrusa]|uniref:Uncharacterized protein n=1 Tax=Caerostris extrusa TaxID=172846 RepID=A0AAV4VKH9_CAEEX|nr:hypothetical protein CEXT_476761 [Caerostris extrusa]
MICQQFYEKQLVKKCVASVLVRKIFPNSDTFPLNSDKSCLECESNIIHRLQNKESRETRTPAFTKGDPSKSSHESGRRQLSCLQKPSNFSA